MKKQKATSGPEQPKGTNNYDEAGSKKSPDSIGVLLVKTARAWIEDAQNSPIPNMLFSEFWYEGELCILFADTNLGKTILAVQIGDSISLGIPIKGFKIEAPKQPVMYFDFELNKKQFERRYSREFYDHYPFDDNFIRVEINPDAEIPEKQTFENYLYSSIEEAIIRTGAKVLIVDNITYLKSETERAKDALPLMKQLKALKNKHSLSILALAHTPKRDMTKPLTKNDLQGSKMLINFCDSCFAIGESNTDKSLRYLKQIKERSSEKLYDAENVCICQVCKPFNFLQFEFLNFGNERDHLKEFTGKDKEELKNRIIELHNQKKSLRDIAAILGISHMAVKRILDKDV